MGRLNWRVNTMPIPVQLVHETAPVSRNSDHSSHRVQDFGQETMIRFCHFRAVSPSVLAGLVHIRRDQIEESFGSVVQSDYVDRWPILDLNTQKPFSHFR